MSTNFKRPSWRWANAATPDAVVRPCGRVEGSATYARRWEIGPIWLLYVQLWQFRTSYILPVVPHKAAAEVSRIGHYRGDWLLWVTDDRAKTLMDRTVQVSRWLIDELTNWLIITNWLTVLLINWLKCLTDKHALSNWLIDQLSNWLSDELTNCLTD